jgi:hypothetical protein
MLTFPASSFPLRPIQVFGKFHSCNVHADGNVLGEEEIVSRVLVLYYSSYGYFEAMAAGRRIVEIINKLHS